MHILKMNIDLQSEFNIKGDARQKTFQKDRPIIK